MTALEIILLIILWVIIGTWISYKRNWYKGEYCPSDKDECILMNIVFAPLVLIIVLFKYFILGTWNEK